MKESKEYMRGWLRGFFDGEGGAYAYWRKARREGNKRLHVGQICAANTSQELIERAAKYLKAFDIRYSIRTQLPKNPKYKPCYSIEVRSLAVIDFVREVGFTENRKQEVALSIVNSNHRPTPPTREQMESMRILYKEGQSFRQIAPHFGYKSGEGIRRLLIASGVIPRTLKEAHTNRLRNRAGQFIPLSYEVLLASSLKR